MARFMGLSRLVLSLALPASLATQNLGPVPEEVRVSSRPYLPTLHSDTNIVQVGVVVRDSKGRTVGGLHQEDFKVLDEGKERAIASFAVNQKITSAPPASADPHPAGGAAPLATSVTSPTRRRPARFIALYFDDIGTPEGDLMRTKKAAQRFVQDGVDANDVLAVFTSRDGRTSDFSADKAKLNAAIEKVHSHQRFNPRGVTSCPRITAYDAYLIANHFSQQALQAKVLEAVTCQGPPEISVPGGTPLPGRGKPLPPQVDPATQGVIMQSEQIWSEMEVASRDNLDAIRGIIDSLSTLPGNRMLLMVSSGFITGTMLDVEDSLATRALKAGVVINAIDAKGLFVEDSARLFGEDAISQYAPPQVLAWEAISATDAKEVPNMIMSDLAAATGGTFFHNNNDYSFGFRELGALPEVSYVLTFRPDDAAFNGKYHKLRIKLASAKTYQVEYRPGYFAAQSTADANNGRAELDRLAATLDPVHVIPAAAAIGYGPKSANGSTQVHVQLHVDVKALHFTDNFGRRNQRLAFVAILFDGEGRMVAGREGEMKFALTPAKFESMSKTGVNAVLNLEAPPGTYRMRAVVLDAQGKAAALAYAVIVP